MSQTHLCAISMPNRKREQLRRVLVSIQLQLRKGRSMPLDWLTNCSLFAIKLHRPFDLEGRGIRRVPSDTNEHHPFLIGSDAVIDDLCTSKVCVSVKNLLWRSRRVRN